MFISRFIRAWLFRIAVLVSIGMVLVGAQKTYVSFSAATPVQIECARRDNSNVQGIWLKLSGCTVDFNSVIAVYKNSWSPVVGGDYFVPLSGGAKGSASPLVLKLTDGAGIALARELFHQKELLDQKDSGTAQRYEAAKARYWELVRTLDARFAGKVIEGVLQTGLDDDRRIREAVEKVGRPLTQKWRIIEEGEPPRLWSGLANVAGGAALLFLLWRRPWRRAVVTASQKPAGASI